MKKKWFKGLIRGAFFLIFTLISVSAFGGNSAQASTYTDGTYSVPVKALKTGTTTPSVSQQFFAPDATAVVKDDTATVTMPLQGAGAKFLTNATVNGQSALNSDKTALTFTVPVGKDSTTATFDISVGAGMHEACDFSFDWSSVAKADSTSGETDPKDSIVGDNTSNTTNTTNTTNNTSTSSTDNSVNQNGGANVNTTGNDNNITVNNYGSASSQASNPVVPNNNSTTTNTTVNPNVSNLNYTVLQADGKSTSEANQYYTHVADVAKQSDGTYKITMHVQYGKNSGMTAKGFVPLTVNGQKVADVTYGSDANNYTCSFTFTTPTLDALTKAPVKGTIHVTVGLVNISSDFDVYYKFTGGNTNDSATTGTTNANTPTQAGAVAGETAGTNSAATTSTNDSNGSGSTGAAAGETTGTGTTPTTKADASAQQSSAKLPQTSEMQNITAAVAGLISLILVIATVIVRRKQA